MSLGINENSQWLAVSTANLSFGMCLVYNIYNIHYTIQPVKQNTEGGNGSIY